MRDSHKPLSEHPLQPPNLETAQRIPPTQSASLLGLFPRIPRRRRREERTSSTLSAPSIALLTRSFSSLVRSRPALPDATTAAVETSSPGSNVRAPAAVVAWEAEARAVARGVGVPSGVTKRERASLRSWGGVGRGGEGLDAGKRDERDKCGRRRWKVWNRREREGGRGERTLSRMRSKSRLLK